MGALDNLVKKLNEISYSYAKSSAPYIEKRPRKAKLRTCTPQVKKAIVAKKKAFFEWKKAERPDNKENQK